MDTIKVKKDEIEKVKEQREKAKETAKTSTKFGLHQGERKTKSSWVSSIIC